MVGADAGDSRLTSAERGGRGGAPPPRRVAAIVLAAGTSSRLGQPKQLLPLGGRPLLQHVVDASRESDVTEGVIVLGHAARRVERALRLPPGFRVTVNEDHANGQSSSLRAGLAALPSDADAALILLGDQPLVSAHAIRAIVAAYDRTGASLVQARYGGARWGHPVLLGRAVWPQACRVTGDRGAREVLAGRRGAVVPVDLAGAPPADVDTWDDYLHIAQIP